MKPVLTTLLLLLVSACVLVPVPVGGGKGGGGSAVVCHKGKKTLELPREAVQAHLDHGDTPGPC